MEFFAGLDSFLVKQKIDNSFFRGNRKYDIFHPNGQKILLAFQDNDFMDRNFLPEHHMTMHVTTPEKRLIMHVARPENIFCAAKPTVDVFGPDGNFLARIKLRTKLFMPKYKVVDARNNILFKINKYAAVTSEYKVTDTQGREVGKIDKKFAGILQEMFTDADNFNVTFSKDLNVEVKAILLAATLLIDADCHE